MTAFETKITRSYTQEEIQQILHLAITRQAYEGEFSREQLLEIATELEISPENLQFAEKEWLAKQGDLQKRRDFNTYRRRKFQKQLGKYVIVNTFFVSLNFLGAGTLSWSLYIVLLWGLGLSLKGWNVYQSAGEEYERAFQQWYRNHQIKQSVNTFLQRLVSRAI